MNKKAYSWSILNLLIFFFIIVAAVVGITTFHQGEEKGKLALDTVNNLTWSMVSPKADLNNSIGNFVYDSINLVGKYSFEFSKVAANYGYTHPQVPWKILVIILICSILAPILYYLFLFFIVIFLLFREWRMNKKEKKMLLKEIESRRKK